MSDYEVNLVNDNMQEFVVKFKGPEESESSPSAQMGCCSARLPERRRLVCIECRSLANECHLPSQPRSPAVSGRFTSSCQTATRTSRPQLASRTRSFTVSRMAEQSRPRMRLRWSPGAAIGQSSCSHPLRPLRAANIDELSGSVCLDVINQTWSPMFDMINIFEVFLPQLLRYPNAADPLNGEAAALLMRDQKAYDAKVKGESGSLAAVWLARGNPRARAGLTNAPFYPQSTSRSTRAEAQQTATATTTRTTAIQM